MVRLQGVLGRPYKNCRRRPLGPRVVWLHRCEIVGDYRHSVSVDGEIFKAFGASIHKTQAMRFARGKLELCERLVGGAWCTISNK